MKTKHRGLLAIAAVAALSLTACAGGTDEPAAAAPAETSSATATSSPTPAQSESPSATETPEFLAGAQGPGVGIEDYMLGSWWCKTTGEGSYPSLFGLPASSVDLPDEMIFHGDGRWGQPQSSKLREWEYIEDSLYVEIEDSKGVFVDLPPSIQIPSIVMVTSHVDDHNGDSIKEATNEISFEIDKMTMKTAEFTDPNAEPPSDSGETVTCRK